MVLSVTQPNRPPSPDHLGGFDEHRFSDSHHLLLAGGGPRSVIQVNAEIAFMLLYRQHFDELKRLGAHYDITTTMVERKGHVGHGSAYCAGQTGMMNTGVEGDISFPLPVPANTKELDVVKSFLSYKSRYNSYIGNDYDSYFSYVKRFNLPGAILFRRSIGPMSCSKDGELDHTGAYLMRRTVGEEEYVSFQKARTLAEEFLPFYRLNIMESTSVRGITSNKDDQQLVLVQKDEKENQLYIPTDQVRLNTGTTLRNPVSDRAVHRFMFCQSMNVDHFREYCIERELLDGHGLLKPDKKIISGGLGLSGLDQVSVLDGIMNLFEADDSSLLGYKVTDFAKRRYHNSITFISRSQGKTCYPRHTVTPEWKQNTPVMASTEHLHSLFLHNYGEGVFGIWYDILKASVARATNRTPKQTTNLCNSTEDMLQMQFLESDMFLRYKKSAGDEERRGSMLKKEECINKASRTLYGAWRQAALSLISGYGLESDLANATKRMESYSPLTWKGRQTWLFHRTQISTITSVKFASRTSNMPYIENWQELMRHVASSPVEIHSMFHLLIEAGIASYTQASYSDVRCSSSDQSLKLKGKSYDAFLVSPVFHRFEDETIKSLARQVQPYHESHRSFGKVGKFRRFRAKNGKLLPIEDNGLGGLGFTINEEGVTSRVGSFAVDLNNRASGTSVASSFTLRRMALVHLKAAGIKAAEQVLDDIYHSGKPDTRMYNDEVYNFKSYFEEIYEVWAYLKAIEIAAGNDATIYRTLYDSGLTKDSRILQINIFETSKQALLRKGAEVYSQIVQNIPVFKPPSRDEYYARFVDTTEEEDKNMYLAALKLAKKHMQNRISC